MEKVFEFTIKGIGKGETVEEAWEDCSLHMELDKLDASNVEHELIDEEDE